MNFQLSNITTVPQAILIRHWHNYFENGQTRRIKNLTYSLMPVDHNAIVRKTLLRKGAEGYRALTVFAELISIATRCPQRGLVVDAQGPITAERIAGATGMSDPDVRSGLELLASKEVGWITHVACPKKLIVSGSLRTGRKGKPLQPELIHLDNPSETSPDLHIEWEYHIVDKGNGPETERRLPKALEKLLSADKEDVKEVETVACHTPTPVLEGQKPVACHNATSLSSNPNSVACHTEGVAIQKEPTTGTVIKKPTTPSECQKAKFLRRQQARSRKR
jgi:hypothetical protein